MLNIYNKNNPNKSLVDKKLQGKGSEEELSTHSFLNFEDPTGELPSKKLKWAIFFTRHRVMVHKTSVGVLIVLALVFWLFSIWKWGSYFIFGLADDQRMMAQLATSVDYSLVEQKFAAQPMAVNSSWLLPGGVDKYDAVAQVANPNPDRLAIFKYYFSWGEGQSAVEQGFLLPGESKPLAVLGLSNEATGSLPELVIEDLRWSRISKHKISDPLAWQAQRLDFGMEDFTFGLAQTIEDIPTNVVRFKLINNSPYGFKNPSFYVGLYDDDILTALLPLTLEKLEIGQTAEVDLRNFVNGLRVTAAELFPLINVYDEEVYLPPPVE